MPPTTGTPSSDRPWALRSSSNRATGHETGLRAAEHVADQGGGSVPGADHPDAQAHALGAALPREQAGVEPERTHPHRDEDASDDDDIERHEPRPGAPFRPGAGR